MSEHGDVSAYATQTEKQPVPPLAVPPKRIGNAKIHPILRILSLVEMETLVVAIRKATVATKKGHFK